MRLELVMWWACEAILWKKVEKIIAIFCILIQFQFIHQYTDFTWYDIIMKRRHALNNPFSLGIDYSGNIRGHNIVKILALITLSEYLH